MTQLKGDKGQKHQPYYKNKLHRDIHPEASVQCNNTKPTESKKSRVIAKSKG